jgi:hypothetical protein
MVWRCSLPGPSITMPRGWLWARVLKIPGAALGLFIIIFKTCLFYFLVDPYPTAI